MSKSTAGPMRLGLTTGAMLAETTCVAAVKWHARALLAKHGNRLAAFTLHVAWTW